MIVKNFDSYQRFPSDTVLKDTGQYPSPAKEEDKNSFIMEVFGKIEEFTELKSEIYSRSSSPATTVESMSAGNSPEIEVRKKAAAPRSTLTLKDPERIDLDQMLLEVPTMMMSFRIYKEASPKLKNALSAWSEIAKAIPSEKESAWKEMVGEFSGKDRELIKALESEGYNHHNPEAIAKINSNVDHLAKDSRNVEKMGSMIKLAANNQREQFMKITSPSQTPVVTKRKREESLSK